MPYEEWEAHKRDHYHFQGFPLKPCLPYSAGWEAFNKHKTDFVEGLPSIVHILAKSKTSNIRTCFVSLLPPPPLPFRTHAVLC